ncbi:hypothetical protein BDV25DRAFT_43951 [Aspergillus avenaceus]|uniref:Uncharacterized protein n=1 Tax=Aspergillus avenaceus TaxID=36643 RepID=A0A5N6TKK2_ASPAV|nr:hypothetical protein BDV25DRAFT_43951 [Aspergillus avenaceus]
MAYEEPSENTQGIIEKIRNIIKEEKAVIGQYQAGVGWEYSGEDISNETKALNKELDNDDFQVIKCNVLHLVNNGTIHNRTGHLLIIPLFGSANFGPDEPVLRYHHIIQTRTIYGQNLDLIIVALKKK